jgi:hypothetical protein
VAKRFAEEVGELPQLGPGAQRGGEQGLGLARGAAQVLEGRPREGERVGRGPGRRTGADEAEGASDDEDETGGDGAGGATELSGLPVSSTPSRRKKRKPVEWVPRIRR